MKPKDALRAATHRRVQAEKRNTAQDLKDSEKRPQSQRKSTRCPSLYHVGHKMHRRECDRIGREFGPVRNGEEGRKETIDGPAHTCLL